MRGHRGNPRVAATGHGTLSALLPQAGIPRRHRVTHSHIALQGPSREAQGYVFLMHLFLQEQLWIWGKAGRMEERHPWRRKTTPLMDTEGLFICTQGPTRKRDSARATYKKWGLSNANKLQHIPLPIQHAWEGGGGQLLSLIQPVFSTRI